MSGNAIQTQTNSLKPAWKFTLNTPIPSPIPIPILTKPDDTIVCLESNPTCTRVSSDQMTVPHCCTVQFQCSIAQRSLAVIWCAISIGLQRATYFTKLCSFSWWATIVGKISRPERLVISLNMARRLVRARHTSFLSSHGVVFLGLGEWGACVSKVLIWFSDRMYDTVDWGTRQSLQFQFD